jgi:hypothetical protein
VKETESQIVTAICECLAVKRHFFWRQNTTPTVQKTGDHWQFRRMPKHAKRGVADIILVHVGRPYFLEVKRKGTYQSPEQKEFQEQAEKAGAHYAISASAP